MGMPERIPVYHVQCAKRRPVEAHLAELRGMLRKAVTSDPDGWPSPLTLVAALCDGQPATEEVRLQRRNLAESLPREDVVCLAMFAAWGTEVVHAPPSSIIGNPAHIGSPLAEGVVRVLRGDLRPAEEVADVVRDFICGMGPADVYALAVTAAASWLGVGGTSGVLRGIALVAAHRISERVTP